MLNRIGEALRRLVIPLSFVLPISMLYLSNPSSFELVWKGRMPYLIFLWLLFLEIALSWRKLLDKPLSIATVAITATAPTYLVAIFAFALSDEITELGKLVGVPYKEYNWLLGDWVLSIEYVVLTICFVVSILLIYKIDGLKVFPISIFFIAATSCFYMIDTFYPLGLLNTLQGFVPVIASLTAGILNWIGYATEVLTPEEVYQLQPSLGETGVSGLHVHGYGYVIIAWGCAGVQSLFIYTFIILLFIKGVAISLRRKIIYFAIGAVGTFLVNLLRIVSICVIGVNSGRSVADFFHKYYGELFFIAWIIVYLMLIIYGGQILTKLASLTSKIKHRCFPPKRRTIQ